MDSYAFVCPNCRVELVPDKTTVNTAVCPQCRNLFTLTPAKDAWDDRRSPMATFGKVILYLFATIGLVVGVVFAGCLLSMR